MADKKKPKEAAQIFHGIMKASVKGNQKPKAMNKQEADNKSANLQTMLGHKYYFPGNVEATAIMVGVIESAKGKFDVMVIGEPEMGGNVSAIVSENVLKPVK